MLAERPKGFLTIWARFAGRKPGIRVCFRTKRCLTVSMLRGMTLVILVKGVVNDAPIRGMGKEVGLA